MSTGRTRVPCSAIKRGRDQHLVAPPTPPPRSPLLPAHLPDALCYRIVAPLCRFQLSMTKNRASETFKERVLSVELIEGHRSIMGFHFGRVTNFVKIYVAMPTLVPPARYALAHYHRALPRFLVLHTTSLSSPALRWWTRVARSPIRTVKAESVCRRLCVAVCVSATVCHRGVMAGPSWSAGLSFRGLRLGRTSATKPTCRSCCGS